MQWHVVTVCLCVVHCNGKMWCKKLVYFRFDKINEIQSEFGFKALCNVKCAHFCKFTCEYMLVWKPNTQQYMHVEVK